MIETAYFVTSRIPWWLCGAGDGTRTHDNLLGRQGLAPPVAQLRKNHVTKLVDKFMI
ncbi:MAG: hypothetical protein V3S51_05800 [Dehalococcoidia bacterium]